MCRHTNSFKELQLYGILDYVMERKGSQLSSAVNITTPTEIRTVFHVISLDPASDSLQVDVDNTAAY